MNRKHFVIAMLLLCIIIASMTALYADPQTGNGAKSRTQMEQTSYNDTYGTEQVIILGQIETTPQTTNGAKSITQIAQQKYNATYGANQVVLSTSTGKQVPFTNFSGIVDGDVMYYDSSGEEWLNTAGNITFSRDFGVFNVPVEVIQAAAPQLRLTQDDGVVYNELQTEADGDLALTTSTADSTLVLGETVWKDINVGGAILALAVANNPGKDEFVDSTGTDTGVTTYAFAPTEKASGAFELQHDYKEGSDICFHVHWQGIAAPAGGTDNVNWQITYTVGQVGTALAVPSVITKEIAFTTQYAFALSPFTCSDGTGLEIGDQVVFSLERIAASADEYAGEALLATVGIHYEVDTLGSRQIATK